jgi:hypothetical protein
LVFVPDVEMSPVVKVEFIGILEKELPRRVRDLEHGLELQDPSGLLIQRLIGVTDKLLGERQSGQNESQENIRGSFHAPLRSQLIFDRTIALRPTDVKARSSLSLQDRGGVETDMRGLYQQFGKELKPGAEAGKK